jgi:NAD(P)-dependent dehydrogenase (short-subunit alcohol dehydrogenase family)
MSREHVTLITGASKGIGRATAERLAKLGHHVVGLARSKPDGTFPGEYLSVDLADGEATARVLADLAGRHTIDGLVNNVGLVRPAALPDIRLEDMRAVLDLNLRPALQAAQAVLPAMRAKKFGRIVNISSLTVAGVPFRTSYAAAKAGLVSFTRSWALELAAEGITVNSVAPGPTDTEIFRTNNPVGSESYNRYVGMVPMKRVADPDEIAAVVVFFLSEDASFVTGQTLYVDGGASVGRASF